MGGHESRAEQSRAAAWENQEASSISSAVQLTEALFYLLQLQRPNTPDTVILFKLKTLNDGQLCLMKRFTKLFELTETLHWDVVLMHNEDEELGDAVRETIAKHKHVHSLRMPHLPWQWKRFGLKARYFPKTKWGATYWFAKQKKYRFLWYLEDDVVFTGSWTTFFNAALTHAGDADLMAKFGDRELR